MTRANRPASRVVVCKIKGVPKDDKKTYRVLTSNFLADGGDGFLMFKKALKYKNTGVGILDAMIRYMKASECYQPKIEGRVRKH